MNTILNCTILFIYDLVDLLLRHEGARSVVHTDEGGVVGNGLKAIED